MPKNPPFFCTICATTGGGCAAGAFSAHDLSRRGDRTRGAIHGRRCAPSRRAPLKPPDWVASRYACVPREVRELSGLPPRQRHGRIIRALFGVAIEPMPV